MVQAQIYNLEKRTEKECIDRNRDVANNGGSEGLGKVHQLKALVNEPYRAEEDFWRGKSKVTWFRERDQNTRYFHVVTVERKKRNKITRLTTEEGKECRE